MAKATTTDDPHPQDLSDYEERYLSCRDLRHAWQPTGYFRDTYGSVRRRLTCSRCSTTREDRWDGTNVHRSYEYPDGYRTEGGRIHAIDVRDEILKRVTVYPSQDAMLQALTKPTRPRKVANAAAKRTRTVDLRDKQPTAHRRRTRATARR